MEKTVKTFIAFFLCGAVVCTQAGCSAFFSGTQHFTVSASEPDADIFVNGVLAGQGSATKRVPRNKNVAVMARKEGCLPEIRHIGTTLSPIGKFDVLCGYVFLVPLIGLLFPGSRALDKDNVMLVLEKEER